MKELIDVYRMEELSVETRANLIVKLGSAINNEHGANLTEPVVVELVRLLKPDHKIFSDDHYSRYL